MKQDIQTELAAQESLVFVWKAGHVAAIVLFALIGWNGHPNVMLALFICQGFFHLVKWPPIRDELARRRKIVAFKQQVENLYVFSLSPDGGDKTVAQTFEDTLAILQESGNQHEVRVHMAVFQDVLIFTAYFDSQGRRQNERSWREKGSATESWEEYQAWCEQFYREDRDKRLRQLRTDNSGFEWVNQHYFDQEYVRQGN